MCEEAPQTDLIKGILWWNNALKELFTSVHEVYFFIYVICIQLFKSVKHTSRTSILFFGGSI